jgi:hypothetical protein
VHKNKIFNKKQSYIIETKADDMIRQAGDLLRRLLSPSLRRKAAQAAIWPPIGGVRFGHFRSTKPIGADFAVTAVLKSIAIILRSFYSSTQPISAGMYLK